MSLAQGLREMLGEDRVCYCAWDGRRSRFVSAHGFDLTGRAGHVQAGGEISGKLPASGRRGALKTIARGFRGLVPEGVRLMVVRLLKPLGAATGHVADRVASRIASLMVWRGRDARRSATESNGPTGYLRDGDVLVTLGLEWETGFMPVLQGLKETLRIRIIGCCHDVIPVKYPQYCLRYVVDRFPEYLAQLARACDAIACVSQCSLRDLQEVLSDLGEPVPQLFRIRLGDELPGGDGPPSERVSQIVGQPYVLCVATLERRKNHEILYRAFYRLTETYDRDRLPKLVFVGAQGWGVGDLLNDIALDPRTRGLVVHLQGVSDSDLRVLYGNALFCACPSLYEGWGLPVAEALGFGKPVICSDRGALSEVGGDLVEYVDPWDLLGWVAAIERLWLDEAWRRSLADRIRREFEASDWSAATASLAQIAVQLEEGSFEDGESGAWISLHER